MKIGGDNLGPQHAPPAGPEPKQQPGHQQPGQQQPGQQQHSRPGYNKQLSVEQLFQGKVHVQSKELHFPSSGLGMSLEPISDQSVYISRLLKVLQRQMPFDGL